MSILNFSSNKVSEINPALEAFLKNFSIEVMPRTASKIENFKELLPQDTRVYVAHIEGTPINEMIETAKRLTDEGYNVMPHFPARIIESKEVLVNWINRYKNEAGVKDALLLAGGVNQPYGEFHSSMDLLDTGEFDKAGFKNLHVAGHPEGNMDIDTDGKTKNVDSAISWKQEFSQKTDANMAITTQFCFESGPVIEWADRMASMGIDIPIHIGVAGPAKLQTMIKFSMACGVGASLRVLKRRAKDVTKLLLPFKPDQFLTELAEYKALNPNFLITNVHFFPLGGIKTNANWTIENGGISATPALQS
ncbi:methylenetetrahydrofolate reductase [Amylibacter sp.]|jgi:methylenetetrahydrofolate reductase (NADPH)|nr:methylenetetrahydrofolate reductase [Rhodobacterales bacterium]MDA9031721.1 methylenetetrahydrofolate reductase [Amylibacter sp.]MBT6009535.1 methylenetetrahydrofolate reductase [Rhodobacterales bacterium]MBT6832668.1 methylenetetrahydrofolate reductase [Rhodobacterales bacterium]MBT7559570.1 methylenetetrahydrofolate reductase [Rhodobacterales bacterium]|tara:strand:+ start:132 stop:1052 length:921 start_codon:yes stop_codon:yes gene_type:complete